MSRTSSNRKQCVNRSSESKVIATGSAKPVPLVKLTVQITMQLKLAALAYEFAGVYTPPNLFRISPSKFNLCHHPSCLSRVSTFIHSLSFLSSRWYTRSIPWKFILVMASGTKRVITSRRKTPVHKRASTSSDDPPLPLSQVPLRRWFAKKGQWDAFKNIYSKMPIIKPRYLIERLLSEDKYPDFLRLLNIQGLRPLLFLKERYYPRLMAAIAATIHNNDTLDKDGNGEF
ncbi:hypothetical protein PIB30_011743 [Stylosanthes scabra]|uniref:Uncharacterized protein n=1 Tax=Stylosanthes scabra TaxID=79078 RepID=A0ABU6Z3H2_9FABA|nr:hypothetical protein [Stylosanthes scabra]